MRHPFFTTFLWRITVSILLFSCSGALPAPAAPALRRQDLSNRPYASYQISDGVGGNAEVEAGAVILGKSSSSVRYLHMAEGSTNRFFGNPIVDAAPFHGVELAKVPYDVFEKLGMMWEDIDYANEVAFPRALQHACTDGAEGAYAALAVGKTKNEVLLQTVSRSDCRSQSDRPHVLFRPASKFCKSRCCPFRWLGDATPPKPMLNNTF